MKSLLVHMSSLFFDEGWSPEGAIHCDFSEMEGTVCYCDKNAEEQIEERFKTLPLNAIHWIDGGDFHYLTEIWMRRMKEPFSLILIDNHPDDQKPAFGGEILSCGGWVAHSRRTNPLLTDNSDTVYLSIDLDYLNTDYARTNWNQGTATLQELLDMLDTLLYGKKLAGVDICGGITSQQGGTPEDFAINRRTRTALLDYFETYSNMASES